MREHSSQAMLRGCAGGLIRRRPARRQRTAWEDGTTTLFDLETWQRVAERTLSEFGATLASFVPSLVGALLLLLVGWLLARIVELASQRLLRTAGLDRVAARLGVGEVLEHTGNAASLSEIVARLLFWLVLLLFVLSSIETIGLVAVTATIDRLVAFIPKLIAAGLIVLLGVLAARFVGGVVASASAAAGIEGAARLGLLAQGAIVALVAVVAIEQLGIATQILVGPPTALVAAAGLAAGLSFALGARPIVTHILAGHFLKQSLPRDSFVEVAGRRGVVEHIGPTDTVLRNGDESWSIPNHQLLEQVVDR